MWLELLIFLVMHGAFGLVCAAIAESRGRSGVGWFFIGAVFHCFALILLLVLPDERVRGQQLSKLRSENHRLRERVKKDRMKADQRHSQIERRLGAHDEALGVDTAESLEAPLSHLELGMSESDLAAVSWFYLNGRDRVGPMPFQKLQRMWQDGYIEPNTYVWTAGQDDWQPIQAIPHLPEALNG